MRKVRIFEHISLDGVIQHAGDDDGDFPYAEWTAPYRSRAGADQRARVGDHTMGGRTRIIGFSRG